MPFKIRKYLESLQTKPPISASLGIDKTDKSPNQATEKLCPKWQVSCGDGLLLDFSGCQKILSVALWTWKDLCKPSTETQSIPGAWQLCSRRWTSPKDRDEAIYSQTGRVTGTQIYLYFPGVLSSSQAIYRNYEVDTILTDGQRAMKDRKIETISGWQDISSGMIHLFLKK